jgi:hypothetical protein
MFKKTLLALALAGTAVSANAATSVDTSTTDALTISSQGLPATKAVKLVAVANAAGLEALAGTATNEYFKIGLKATDNTVIVAGSRLVVNVTGAFFANPATAIASTADADVDSGDNDETFTVNATDSTSTKLVITLGGTLTIADDDFIRLGNIELITTGSSVKFDTVIETASKVAVSSTASAAQEVAKISDQWSAGVVTDVLTPTTSGVLNNQIDVGDSRKTFVGGVTSDTLTFDVNTIASSVSATPTSVVAKIVGDFTGVKTVTASTNSEAAVTYKVNTGKTEATATYTTTTGTTAAEILNNQTIVTLALYTAASEKVALEVRNFNLDLDAAYTDAESNASSIELLSAANAGSWALNGVSITNEYMPYGPNTAMIIQATSTFNEDASLSISYQNQATGKMVTLTDIGTVKANSVTKLGSIVSDAIMADSGTESGKTRIVYTVNAPTGKVKLFTGFKDTADKDRLGVGQ